MTEPLLRVNNLNVSYGAVKALQGVTVDVYEGEIVSLIGANGAGKSTFLRAISGLAKPASGEIEFRNGGAKPTSLVGIPAHEIVTLGIAHAPEGRQIFSLMTVDENLQLGAYTRRDSEIEADRERVLMLFPRLRERLKQQAGTMSGGEQQMLAIGRALLAKPKLLLLDEPSLGLAPLLVRTIFETIQAINGLGMTVLLVEQNAHMALQISHRSYVLETGQVMLSGKSSDLAQDPAVRKAYLGE